MIRFKLASTLTTPEGYGNFWEQKLSQYFSKYKYSIVFEISVKGLRVLYYLAILNEDINLVIIKYLYFGGL